MQLEKLLRASREGSGKKRRKGVLQTLQSIPEGHAGFNDTAEASGRLCADGPQQHELVTGNWCYNQALFTYSLDLGKVISVSIKKAFRK